MINLVKILKPKKNPKSKTHIVCLLVAIRQSVDHLIYPNVTIDCAQIFNRRINTFRCIANNVILKRFDEFY